MLGPLHRCHLQVLLRPGNPKQAVTVVFLHLCKCSGIPHVYESTCFCDVPEPYVARVSSNTQLLQRFLTMYQACMTQADTHRRLGPLMLGTCMSGPASLLQPRFMQRNAEPGSSRVMTAAFRPSQTTKVPPSAPSWTYPCIIPLPR